MIVVNVNPSLVNNEPISEPFEMYVFKKAKCCIQNLYFQERATLKVRFISFKDSKIEFNLVQTATLSHLQVRRLKNSAHNLMQGLLESILI